jgi:hypothetical protein
VTPGCAQCAAIVTPETAMPTHPFRRLLLASALLLLAACGGGGDAPGDPPPGQTPQACLAPAETVSWFHGSQGQAQWNDVRLDAQGRIWLAGYDGARLGEGTLDPGGNSRAVLRQLDAQGRLLWDSGTLFDSAGPDSGEIILFDASGAPLLVGRAGASMAGGTHGGQFDVFTAQRGASGSWRFAQTGDARPQTPRRAEWLNDGGLLIAGYDDTYVPTNYVEAWADSLALRLGADGQARWQHRSQSAEPDRAEGLALAGGAVVIGGGNEAGAQRGLYVRKLGLDGQARWTARYTASPADSVVALRALPDGSLLMLANVFGSFRGGAWQGQQDIAIARLAADDGRVLASWQYGGSGSDFATDLVVDGDGRWWVLGETDGRMAPGATPAGASDLFLLQISAQGELLASAQWGTADDERASRLAVDRCGGALAVGGSGSATRRAGISWFWKPGR